jgi:copper chaperone
MPHLRGVRLKEPAMTRFAVPDMHCDGCVRSITRAIQGVDPAAEVNADLDARTIAIASGSDSAALQAAIEEAGFTVRPAG